MKDFFIWCAGSDRDLLVKCSQAEQNKHVGYGTLVLIPAVLAFVSMSFALSTVEAISDSSWIHYLGGFLWGLVIFSFDRFIVSTHRRKMSNKAELKNPSFYLRFVFALLLGIVISHPLVMLYFDGSIQDKIDENSKLAVLEIESRYDKQINSIAEVSSGWDSLYLEKVKERDQQALVVSQEIDGEVIANASGLKLTTGLYGKGPAAELKIKQLKRLQDELEQLKEEGKAVKAANQKAIQELQEQKAEEMESYAVSRDYLKRELALDQLKEENGLVGLTEFLLISLFILVDLLPVIFKTFAPFGMYDRILHDDERMVKTLDAKSRALYNQKLYESISNVS